MQQSPPAGSGSAHAAAAPTTLQQHTQHSTHGTAPHSTEYPWFVCQDSTLLAKLLFTRKALPAAPTKCTRPPCCRTTCHARRTLQDHSQNAAQYAAVVSTTSTPGAADPPAVDDSAASSLLVSSAILAAASRCRAAAAASTSATCISTAPINIVHNTPQHAAHNTPQHAAPCTQQHLSQHALTTRHSVSTLTSPFHWLVVRLDALSVSIRHTMLLLQQQPGQPTPAPVVRGVNSCLAVKHSSSGCRLMPHAMQCVWCADHVRTPHLRRICCLRLPQSRLLRQRQLRHLRSSIKHTAQPIGIWSTIPLHCTRSQVIALVSKPWCSLSVSRQQCGMNQRSERMLTHRP